MAERTQTGLNTPQLQIIGFVVESSFTEKFGTPRQGALSPQSYAKIQLDRKFSKDYLEGLAEFSHLWVLWWFHLNQTKRQMAKVHAPRKFGGKVGIFGSRSPHRPNPIGLTLASIDHIKGSSIYCRGVDFTQGTPVLDLKPYIVEDQAVDPQFGWLNQLHEDEIFVEWDSEALKTIEILEQDQRQRLVITIEDSLRLDPRPQIYKKLEKTQGYQGPFTAQINGYDVKFTTNLNRFRVIQLIKLSEYP